MIAYCGLDCTACDTFIAASTNDDVLKTRLAIIWSAINDTEVRPEDINCTGCRGDGPKLPYCGQHCKIRKCAAPRRIVTCAACAEYPCSLLADVFADAPEAKARLDALSG
jgi:hypothetical protein